jgi:hypothetical protein
MRIVSEKVTEKIKTQILCSVTFCFSKIVPFMKNWKNVVQPDRSIDDDIIRRKRIACWLTKATDSHSICNTY